MASKRTYIIELKLPERPWVEYCRTQVKSAVERYEEDVRREFPGAEYRTRPFRA